MGSDLLLTEGVQERIPFTRFRSKCHECLLERGPIVDLHRNRKMLWRGILRMNGIHHCHQLRDEQTDIISIRTQFGVVAVADKNIIGSNDADVLAYRKVMLLRKPIKSVGEKIVI